MDKVYPPAPPKMIEQTMSREDSTQQLPGEEPATLTTPKEAQLTTVKESHRITTMLISRAVSSTIKQEHLEPEPGESDKTISISSINTVN